MATKLVSTVELAAHLADPGWIVFDCRNDLVDAEAGPRAYARGHVPGAIHIHADRILSGPKTGTNGRHPLPAPEAFCASIATLGMDGAMQAVAYDGAGGLMASRLWWMLRWIGHERVAVLDGGWKLWTAENRPVDTATPARAPGHLACQPAPWTVDASFVERNLGRPDAVLLDARGADRFRGENETLDPVGGHIPGARNRPYSENLTAEGRFKDAATLRGEFEQALAGTPAGSIVHQCGSGISACHNLLAMEIAGLSGSRLYPGSWSEWSADPRRPVAR